MNLDASAIAPQFQWLWIVVCIVALGSGAIVAAFSTGTKALMVAGIQGTLLSLILLGTAPTALEEQQAAIEQQQTVETQIADYAELLDAEVLELYPESGEADLRDPELGLISVGLEEGYLKILTGDKAGMVWYLDALIREHRLQELEG